MWVGSWLPSVPRDQWQCVGASFWHYCSSLSPEYVGWSRKWHDRASCESSNLAPLCPVLIHHGNRDRLGEMVLHFGSALAARAVLIYVELVKLMHQKLRQSEQLRHQRRIGVGVPVVDSMVRFWLGQPGLSKFPVLHKLGKNMLVLPTSGCYRNDLFDDSFDATSYNVVVGVINAVRSYFTYWCVSSSCLLYFAKMTACREAIAKNPPLAGLLMISPWESLSIRNWGALVIQYVNVLWKRASRASCTKSWRVHF